MSRLKAFRSSLSTSIVPTTFVPSRSKTGTMISERVELKAVKYRESAATSPTFTICFWITAVPVSPLPSGKEGYSGAPGPIHTTFLTIPAL